ncbi:hypothetical protein D3C73_843410 [compost metagenome]
MQGRLLKRLAVNGVAPVIGDLNIPEKGLNPVGLPCLPRVAAEPFIVQPDVGRDPVSITEEVAEVSMRLGFSRGSIIVGIFGG